MINLTKYSFERIIQLCPYDDRNVFDGCMIIRYVLKPGIIQFPFKVDAFAAVFCINGEVNVTLNLKTYTVNSNTLFIQLPNNTIKAECKDTCTIMALVLSPDYLRKNLLGWNKITPIIMRTADSPIVSLPAEKWDEFILTLKKLRERMKSAGYSEWNREGYHAALKTFFYDVFGQITDPALLQGESLQTRNQDYFARFMQLLSQYCKKERKVNFYASQLCVSSKYLSTIIKNASGKTPSKWIDEVVMAEAIFLLKYTNATVQEIAFQMNFPNPSFFGKFFKRYTGFSPNYYRANNVLLL